MGKRTAIGLTACSIWVATALVSLAEEHPAFEPTFGLVWQAPEGCPTREQLLQEVRRLLGGQSALGSSALQFAVSAQSTEAGWRVVVHSSSGGERVLEGDTCKNLADGVALIVALAVDPTRVAATQERRSPTAPSAWTQPVAPAGPSAYLPTRLPSPPAFRSADTWVASVQGLGSLGTFPGPAVGLGAGVGWMTSRFRIDVNGILWPNQRSYIGSDSSYGGEFRLLGGAASSCYLPGNQYSTRIRFDICGGVEFGQMRGVGFGVTSPRQGGSVWVAWTFGAGARWILGPRAAIRLSLGAGVPAFRPRFILEEVGPVHRPSAIDGRVAFGPELNF